LTRSELENDLERGGRINDAIPITQEQKINGSMELKEKEEDRKKMILIELRVAQKREINNEMWNERKLLPRQQKEKKES
jgi:hypothetical protein